MSPDAYELLAILVLVAAAVPIVYGVGYFVWGYIRYRQQERARGPERQIMHPDLGLMTGSDSLWEGKVAWRDGTITFVVSGSESEPDPRLTSAVQGVLNRIEEHRRLAVDRLIDQELEALLRPAERPPIPHGAFKLDAIQCLWEGSPNRFALEFSLEGDPDGVWRVEFENDRPVATGRDD